MYGYDNTIRSWTATSPYKVEPPTPLCQDHCGTEKWTVAWAFSGPGHQPENILIPIVSIDQVPEIER